MLGDKSFAASFEDDLNRTRPEWSCNRMDGDDEGCSSEGCCDSDFDSDGFSEFEDAKPEIVKVVDADRKKKARFCGPYSEDRCEDKCCKVKTSGRSGNQRRQNEL